MDEFFNTGLTHQQFLDEYWQKKPLLIRQAFKGFKSPISPDDLAGLACEPEIESRLIEEKGINGSWQISHGPFSDEVFNRLPETHWTVLVQDVDKHLPELQYLLDPFRFIPDWRRDDLMVSYAPEHGTVGPHTDGYDVFLLQAMGTRNWKYTNHPVHNSEQIEGIDVQILAEFFPDQDWDLEPGDMLYLPPYVAHHGVAKNDCMTFSIGFRAPSQTDLLDAVISNLLEKELATGRYNDASLITSAHPHQIDQAAIDRLKQLLHMTIDQAAPILADALGRYVSETKSSLTALAEETWSDLLTVSELNKEFEEGANLQRSLYHRFAWHIDGSRGTLFMAGEPYLFDEKDFDLLPLLAENSVITLADWQRIKTSPQSANVLCQLISEGGFYWAD